ncbi:hypothetical protein H0H81_002160 [Sphagnurus paluster]|uniref:Cytochrome P450 n=1 Tax=Sphagnurus paluster TaxID=117069 RepID=A0A9P7K6L6_9AGAR|nr:hypothetical protein H0H81_002160 [Sphagnurus paluster]
MVTKRSGPPLPPGPPADPIIGHVRKMPTEKLENTLYEWGKVYGRPVVVLNSAEAAIDLLDKRSANYSDRPPFVTFGLIGWVRALPSVRYGKKFQKLRHMAQEYFSAKKSVAYHSIPARETRVLLQNLLSDEKERDHFLGRFSISIIIKIMCGHQISSEEDPLLHVIEEAASTMENAGPPGNTAVDFFPFLQYFPSWFPGTYYAAYARKNKFKIDRLHQYPLELVKKQLTDQTQSWISKAPQEPSTLRERTP